MPEKIRNSSEKVRLLVIVLMTAVILAAINFAVIGKERILRNGTSMSLRIAPRDPRSLLQGDYMVLRYSIAADVARHIEQFDVHDGTVVVQLGELNEAIFVAHYNGQQLADRQYLLRYRKRGGTVRLASDAYFFEEGSADEFNGARFGEVRVNAKGDAVLTGLLDEAGKRLGPPLF